MNKIQSELNGDHSLKLWIFLIIVNKILNKRFSMLRRHRRPLLCFWFCSFPNLKNTSLPKLAKSHNYLAYFTWEKVDLKLFKFIIFILFYFIWFAFKPRMNFTKLANKYFKLKISLINTNSVPSDNELFWFYNKQVSV